MAAPDVAIARLRQSLASPRPMQQRNYLRVELYREMARSAAFFDFLQRGALEGVWYWDLVHPDSIWISPEFWRALGYAPSEMKHSVGQWQSLMHKEDLALLLEGLHEHLRHGTPLDLVVRYQSQRRTTVWMRCRGSAKRDASGRALRMVGVHTNVTALVRGAPRRDEFRHELSNLQNKVEALQMQLDVSQSEIAILKSKLRLAESSKRHKA